jgi:8-oxo-dGTP diphosphatase
MTDTAAAFPLFGDWTAPGPNAGAHLLVHDRDGRLLLQLRDMTPGIAYPGWWSLFGGGVEGAEPLRQAAVRELAEETGLVADPRALEPFGRTLSRWGTRRLRLFVYRWAWNGRPEEIRLGEGAGFALATAAQLDTLPVIPEFLPILKAHGAT